MVVQKLRLNSNGINPFPGPIFGILLCTVYEDITNCVSER